MELDIRLDQSGSGCPCSTHALLEQMRTTCGIGPHPGRLPGVLPNKGLAADETSLRSAFAAEA